MSEFARGLVYYALQNHPDTSLLVSELDPAWEEDELEAAALSAVCSLHSSSRPIVARTVVDSILAEAKPEIIRSHASSKAELIERIESWAPVSGASVQSLIDQLKLDHTRRSVRQAAHRVIDSLPSFQTAEDAASRSIEIIASSISSTSDYGASDASTAVESYLRMVEEEKSDAYKKWDWPFQSWSRRASFRQSNIAVFAAPSEAGKTHFGLQQLAIACKAGDRVAFFTGEMTKEELIGRLHQQEGGGEAALMRIMGWDLVIYDGVITVDRMVAAAIRAKSIGKPFHMMIVDHVHLMQFAGKDGYRIALNDGMATIKGEIANRHKIGVLLLAQLRKPKAEEGKHVRPRKSDIRESAAIENIADWIFLMARANEDDVEDTTSIIWCDKRRNGMRFPEIMVHIHPDAKKLVEGQSPKAYGIPYGSPEVF